ncbi:MAG: hypothetical protein MZW92_07960 [Comamonadaceae bacterium]|nr:hypothetical protein [Comamonadaceae bacterium]
MGREPARADNFGVLDAMGGADVLILDRNRRRSLDGPRGERLLAWVESGGYLLVAAEQSGVDDPLLQALGVEWAPAAVGECRSGRCAGHAGIGRRGYAGRTARDNGAGSGEHEGA